MPVDPDRAFGDLVVAREQRGDRGFAGPGLANQRDRLTGLDFELEVEQHPHVLDVLERDVVELHMPGDVGQVSRVRRVFNLWRGVEHFKDALSPGHRALEHRVLEHQIANGVEEALNANRKRNDRGDADLFGDRAIAQPDRRDHDDQRGRNGDQNLDQRHDRRREHARPPGRAQVPVVDSVEATRVFILAVETLDDAHAVQVFVQG